MSKSIKVQCVGFTQTGNRCKHTACSPDALGRGRGDGRSRWFCPLHADQFDNPVRPILEDDPWGGPKIIRLVPPESPKARKPKNVILARWPGASKPPPYTEGMAIVYRDDEWLMMRNYDYWKSAEWYQFCSETDYAQATGRLVQQIPTPYNYNVANNQKRCFVCADDKKLAHHHIVHARYGHERLGDVILLCPRCHDTVHLFSRLKWPELDIDESLAYAYLWWFGHSEGIERGVRALAKEIPAIVKVTREQVMTKIGVLQEEIEYGRLY